VSCGLRARARQTRKPIPRAPGALSPATGTRPADVTLTRRDETTGLVTAILTPVGDDETTTINREDVGGVTYDVTSFAYTYNDAHRVIAMLKTAADGTQEK